MTCNLSEDCEIIIYSNQTDANDTAFNQVDSIHTKQWMEQVRDENKYGGRRYDEW